MEGSQRGVRLEDQALIGTKSSWAKEMLWIDWHTNPVKTCNS